MNAEQKAVVLDYAQELQSNDEPWREFEFKETDNCWYPCTKNINPCVMLYSDTFRRKPKTITVTVPVPVNGWAMGNERITLLFKDETDRDTALAAIRGAMGNE